jgi:tRNA A37 N6-isopentenylltransferase MiaA
MKAVGVREIAALLRGEMRPGDTIAAMQQATRRYAKRQYTWFRARPAESVFLRRIVTTEQFSERDSAEIFAFIRQTGLTAEA